ncbi:MAG: ribonuclease E/G, partial [Syntrophomonas sp.]
CQGRGHIINLFALACEVKRKLANMGYLENETLVCEAHPQLIKYISEDEKNLEYIRNRTQKSIKLISNSKLGQIEYNLYAE